MKVVISGVAGFIGAQAAATCLARGDEVVGLDNLSRRGNQENLQWLHTQPGQENLQFTPVDIRHDNDVMQLFEQHPDAEAILHLAGQVAVTTSIVNPRADFEANALGTFNLLEATRQYCPQAAFLYASTNKVYGKMADVPVVEGATRYTYRDLPQGVDEATPLEFYSPYGCSKGAGDQYVRDYARIYGLKTVVFRQSCIYGTRQFGIEDQGWVAWFTIASVLGKPMTIYGDGKQVRDLLWVGDLIDLYLRAIANIATAAGQIYNAGGGAANSMSLLELSALLSELMGRSIKPPHADWRPGDQKVFIANVHKAQQELGWSPRTTPQVGIRQLLEWTCASQELLQAVLT